MNIQHVSHLVGPHSQEKLVSLWEIAVCSSSLIGMTLSSESPFSAVMVRTWSMSIEMNTRGFIVCRVNHRGTQYPKLPHPCSVQQWWIYLKCTFYLFFVLKLWAFRDDEFFCMVCEVCNNSNAHLLMTSHSHLNLQVLVSCCFIRNVSAYVLSILNLFSNPKKPITG